MKVGSFMMKKIIAALIMLCGAFFNAVSEGKNSAGIEIGIGSGYVFYGDKKTKDLISDMNSDDYSRFLIGGDVGFFIPLAEKVLFTGDAELMTDLFWNGGDHCYFLDYSFNTGIKVYPGLGGLGFGVAYCLGRRTSFIDIDDYDETDSTSWGNGFKFNLDYDIRYGKDGVCPVIGTYWRHMPRGNSSSDNAVSIYLKLFFR